MWWTKTIHLKVWTHFNHLEEERYLRCIVCVTGLGADSVRKYLLNWIVGDIKMRQNFTSGDTKMDLALVVRDTERE